jgi:hypothetical protein
VPHENLETLIQALDEAGTPASAHIGTLTNEPGIIRVDS